MTDLKQKAREWLDGNNGVFWATHELLADFAAQCVADEREACAKIADKKALEYERDSDKSDSWEIGFTYGAGCVAELIRARKDS